MTHVDLFSGIGGFALAARWAGLETVQFVEIDKFCQKVLQKNFPGVPIHDDIKTFKYAGTTPFILTGGFPCQPFSCAGKRRGKEDDRYLWPEMLRVISEVKPTWIIGENVAGFINMGLDDCISDLEAQGYEVQAFIVPACAVNAPHRRDRVWIVANTGHTKTARQREYRRETLSNKETGLHCEKACHAAHTNGEGLQRDICGQLGGISSQVEPSSRGKFRREIPTVEQWQEPWIEAATRLCRVDDGVSDRVHRLKALGNAIVPQVAYQIIKGIVEIELYKGVRG